MKLIVGIGNPGDRYNFTRHNFGFLALDFYAKLTGSSFDSQQKHHSLYFKTPSAFFIKPQTFYNDSGLAVSAFVNYYKIPTSDILVICDDFDMGLGAVRFRTSGSPSGNNGLKSIIKHLGTSDFPRLRLGTNNPELRAHLGDTDFVLSKFTPAEKLRLPEILNYTKVQIDAFLLGDPPISAHPSN